MHWILELFMEDGGSVWNSEDCVLHRMINKDLSFFKAVIKISESQRRMNESAKKESKMSY